MTGVTVKIKDDKSQAAIVKERFRRAEQVLKREKEKKELDAIITKDKEWFRDEADGETLTQVVPGLGQVQVKKGAASSSGTSYAFSTDKFKELPQKTRDLLIKNGVVTISSYTTPPGTPAVCLTLNK